MRAFTTIFLALALFLACGGETPKESGNENPGNGGGKEEVGGVKPLRPPPPGEGGAGRGPPPTPEEQALTAIAIKVASNDPEHRMEAIELMYELPDRKQAGELAMNMLEDKNEDIRSMAVEAVGQFEYAPAAAGLRKILETDEAALVRKQALISLSLVSPSTPVGDYIGRLEKDDESTVRATAANLLGEAKNPAAIDPLLKAMGGDMAPAVRLGCVDAIRKMKTKRAVDAVIERLDDANELVRIEAAKALGEIGEKKAVPPLIGMLDPDAESNFLASATKALCKLTGEKNEYKSDDSDEERADVLEEWQAWWEENKAAY